MFVGVLYYLTFGFSLLGENRERKESEERADGDVFRLPRNCELTLAPSPKFYIFGLSQPSCVYVNFDMISRDRNR